MPEQFRPTPSESSSLSGVYPSDAFCPPVPPLGARAIETRDETGRVIGFGWAAQEHAETLLPAAYDWHDRVTRVSYLRLVR